MVVALRSRLSGAGLCLWDGRRLVLTTLERGRSSVHEFPRLAACRDVLAPHFDVSTRHAVERLKIQPTGLVQSAHSLTYVAWDTGIPEKHHLQGRLLDKAAPLARAGAYQQLAGEIHCWSEVSLIRRLEEAARTLQQGHRM